MRANKNLESKLILWVVGAALAVSALFLIPASTNYWNFFENEIRHELDHAMKETIHSLDLRLSRIEYATQTAASLIGEQIIKGNNIDSMMIVAVENIACIDAASIIFEENYSSQTKLKSNGERYISFAYRNNYNTRKIDVQESIFENSDNRYWAESYYHGTKYWGEPFSLKINNKEHEAVYYSIPLSRDNGDRYAVFCSIVWLEWMENIVRQHKARKDIDVSIYATDGKCIVAPDDYILKLNPEDLIVEKRTMGRLGWTIVFSADRNTIITKVKQEIVYYVVTVLLIILAVLVAIILSIKYVVRPFIREQRETAEVKAAMQRELDLAAKAQQELIPHKFPPFPERKDINIYAYLHPARDVGGDLYDYFISNDYLYFCIGDVSGKGVPASLFMTATHYLFRTVADESSSPAEAVSQMNKSLCTDNDQCMFVTFFFGKLNLKTGELEYCNAGHNSPIMNQTYLPEAKGMPLGVFDEAEYVTERIHMAQDDILYLYTDGVTEAKNTEGQNMGDAKVLEVAKGCKNHDGEQYLNVMLSHIRQHTEGEPQSDDITMLYIKR